MPSRPLTTIDRCLLYLNNSQPTQADIDQLEAVIDGACAFIDSWTNRKDVLDDLEPDEEIPRDLEHAATQLAVYMVKELQRAGVKAETFNNVYVKYDDTMPPSIDRILERYRSWPIA